MERHVVGVISDTHGLLRPEAVAALASVDLILHAGDIGSAAVLDELGSIAPVLAVRGNNDRGPWAASVPETVTTEVGGLRLYDIHDLKTLPKDPADLGVDVIISRHSHQPNARICNNIFASAERIARLLDVDDPRKLKHKVVEALRAPLPPIEVKDGACQEVVVTKDIDVWDVVPMISHSDSDPGRTLGAGTTVVRGEHFWGGSHIGYNRMNFRGPDYSSFQISPGSHMDQIATHWYRQGPIPVT